MTVTGVSQTTDDRDAGLRWTVQHAYEGIPFYRERMDEAGVAPGDVTGIADLPKLPFTTKADLAATYPFGSTAVALDEVVRLHASSGTTGRRTVATYTQRDIDDWAEMFARCYVYAGVTPQDRVQITPGYGLWTAGVGFQAGVERLGAMALPVGPGNIDLQFEMMVDFEATVLTATSSFALLLGEQAHERGLRDDLKLRVGIFGSERWGEAMRRRIEELLGIETFDIYGLTELYGPGTGIECSAHDGIHYWDDYYLVEIIDPSTGGVLEPGQSGEIVLTTLRKEAMPLVRYRSRDISTIYPDPCACGSPYPRIARLTGRTDDMVKVRGVAIYPAQVDQILSQVPGLGSEYQLHIERHDGREELTVRVEADTSPVPADLAERTVERLRAGLGLRPVVDVLEPSTLPRSERKTRRVFDHRLDEEQ
jgi:phenylacetate-CoA ligase